MKRFKITDKVSFRWAGFTEQGTIIEVDKERVSIEDIRGYKYKIKKELLTKL